MKIVYYPDEIRTMCFHERGKISTHPSVQWGVVKDEHSMNDDLVYVESYSMDPFICIDGKPIYEFESDTEWKPLPKKWKYNIDLIADRRSVDPRKETCLSEAHNFLFSNPNNLLHGIKQGWLIPSRLADARVESEVVKNKYRIIRYEPPWTQLYGNPPYNRTMLRSKVYEEYADALSSAEQICLDWAEGIQASIAVDKADEVRWVLERIPESQRDNCRYVVENLSFNPNTAFRVYNGQVLYRREWDSSWEVVFQIDQND